MHAYVILNLKLGYVEPFYTSIIIPLEVIYNYTDVAFVIHEELFCTRNCGTVHWDRVPGLNGIFLLVLPLKEVFHFIKCQHNYVYSNDISM